jgi:nucleoside phosphorylase
MSDPQEYTIGWICAIETEYTAAVAFLDEIHTPPDYVSANNRNSYTLGKMSGHNIVIAVRPDGECGPDSATAAAKDMVESFPNVRIGLMVGIGGGAPTAKHDVRLGDIVVGIQHGKTGSVRQYDYGKTMKSRSFQQTGVLISPPAVVLTAVSSLASRYNTAGHEIEASVMAVLERKPRLQQKYGRPPQEIDRLYESELVHPYSSRTCELCCGHRKADIVMRSERGSLAVHYGVIASASQLMRHATIRDIIAKEEGVMCFETEAAGLTDRFPWLIVRGICGYSDSHNNKRWHGYAAITATAYIKDLLTMMVPGQVEQLDPEMPEKQSRIFEWLSAPDPSTNHTKALNKHHGGTGLWFIQGDTFNEWKRLPGSFLWLHGISGCGKTVLTSTIIEHLLRETTCQVLLYFYFDSNDTYKRSLDSLLRSFVIQLCMTGQGASQPLSHLWASHSEGNRQPSTKSLQSILQSMLSGVSNLNIIVDALDESTTRHELLAWLETLVGGSTTSCRLLVTSRREEAIESALQSWTRAEDRVPMQRNEVNKDIRAYIRDRVRNGDEFKRWQQGLDIQEEIEVKLAKNANGM